MCSRMWFTKEDVMLDLEVASGQRVHNLHDKYVVYGQNPPKKECEAEELEDPSWSEQYDLKTDCSKPDLSGIKKMLQMVDEDSNIETGVDESDCLAKLRSAVNGVAVISKLNPNVPEFIPRASQSIENNKALLICKDKSSTNECSLNKDNESETLSKNKTAMSDIIDVNKKIDLSKLKDDDKEKLRENLKNLISNTSNAKCSKIKGKRNVAIASLIRLYSEPSTNIDNTPQDSEKKLMTPLDFINSVPKIENSNKKEDLVFEEVMQNSIEKVDRWLQGPELKPSNQASSSSPKPSIYMGPITFRKREAVCNIQSPISNQSLDSNGTITEFKPSSYATELTERYKKRLKEREQCSDIWTNIQKELKEKDKQILNKRYNSITAQNSS